MTAFTPQSTTQLFDDVLALRLRGIIPADPVKNWVPAYQFHMIVRTTGEIAGEISLRVGEVPSLYLGGHIGYSVAEAHRGHRYARRACRLLLPLARAHGMPIVRITCRPDNLPSRRTLEGLEGARFIEIAPVTPADHDLWADGAREECIFEINLTEEQPL